ncbi:hypothetical protein SLS60_003682 [Paraconiothyrium brasiliense]|uniref:Uncharacterized protein n=1 Tax=Paraconiothyrium brasiliense TaxID=300254 RepID=A0ABR3RPB1_9PLEO
MIGEAEYRDLGAQALSSYPGSGLCGRKCHGRAGIEYQPVHVKEYKHGKWSTYNTTYTYGPPTPRATIYQTPGTYTIPGYDATLYHTTTLPIEATYTASVGSTVTYGGVTTSVSEPCTITAQYGAYTTEGAKSKLIIKTTTIYASEPGHYTIAAPTITKYDHPKECTYPTTTLYQPGVYHHSKATVTITKSNQAYTCSYSRITSSSTPTGYLQYSATKDTYSTPIVPSRSYSGHPASKTSSGPGSQYPSPTISSDASRATHTPSPTNSDEYDTATPTQPQGPDPSSDYEEAEEPYGMASAGYVKRGGMLERRKAKLVAKRSAGKRVILV